MKNVEDLYELSPAQQGMLFHSLQAPASEHDYLIQIGCRLRGPLDAAAFARAWRHVVARHTVLRTSFHWKGVDKPLQVVHRDTTLPLVQEDWRGLPVAEHERRLPELVDREYRSFELSEAPALRLALARLADDEHQFFWTFHHIVLDGWSASLLLGEVFACYRAFRGGKQAELAATRPYRDYILWLQQQDGSTAEAYWRRTLKGFSAPTALAVDRTALDDSPRTQYAEEKAVLPEPASEALRVLARQQRLTLNTLVQGAWALLLSRYSGDDDVVFGTVVSGRPASLLGSPSMVGLFINTLAARVRVDEQEPILSWLARLQAQQVEMREYEHSALVEVQGWSDVPRGRPLFESLLIFENWLGDLSFREWAGELEISDARCLEGGTGYPLTVGASPGPDFPLTVMYDCARFDKTSVVRLLGHLRTLLEGIALDPARRLLELPLVTSEEVVALSRWNATEMDGPAAEALPQLLDKQAALTPDAVAVEFGDQRLTYRELNGRASALARELRALGMGPGTLAGVFMERSLEMLVALLGVLKAGGAYVPLDPAYPGERVSFMLDDSRLSIVLTQASLARMLPRTSARVLCSEEFGRAEGSGLATRLPEVRGDDLAYVIYTSGSTGRPKGVQVTHRSLVNFLESMRRTPGFSAQDVLLSVTTLSFDIAGLELYLPLAVGGRVVLVSREEAADGGRLLSRLKSCGATVMQATPATWRLLLEAGWQDSGLKILCGGESLSRELADRLLERGSSVWNLYGPTETTIWSTLWRVEAGQAPVSIGRPIANTQVHLLDRHGRRVPVGVAGELCIGGLGLARGYLERADLTAERFVPDSFSGEGGARLYRTGDLARCLPDGRIQWLARLDDQVKVRGFRIELGEIEAALLRHPELRQAVVVVREDTPGEKRLVGYVVATPAPNVVADAADTGSSGLAARLRRYLQDTLPDHMLPTSILILDALPLTPNGKVDRRALPKPEGAWQEGEGYVAPRTPTERALAAIWQECLQVSAVGVHDSFFELGGHSLLAMRVASRVQEAFEVEVSLGGLLRRPTLAGLAAAVDEARRGDRAPVPPPLVPGARDRPMRLSFAQERLWFLEQLEPGNALHTIPSALRFRGRLDFPALERSLQEIQRRHEALRTTFTTVDGAPAQVVARAGGFHVEQEDLLGLPEHSRAGECERRLREEAGRFLDPGRGPLFRCRLLRLAPEEHLLVLSVHHLVFDGWSLGVFVGELASLYAAFREGRPSPLAELRIQYVDFASWQRDRLRGGVLERQLAYWKRKLAAPPVLNLPTDRPRPLTQTFVGAQRSFSLPRELSEALQALSRQEGATLFMTLLAAFQTLLSRYTGQEDIVVGSPIAGRLRPELESLIGLFANTLPLRGDLSGDPTFNEILARVRETALEAFDAQDVPFEKLVEVLRPERDLSRTPLFQVMFVLQNAPLPAVELRDLSLTAEAVERAVAQFDLALYMEEGREGLAGALEYNTDLFDPGRMERMIAHFQRLLEGLASNPEARVSKLPLLSDAELEQLGSWNATGVDYTRGALLPDLIEAQVERSPDAVAVEFDGERLTYRELNGRANALGRALRGFGVGPGVLVGIYMERSLEMLVALLGVFKAGGAYVPLDPSYPVERLEYMLEDSGAAVLLTRSSLLGSLPGHAARILSVDEVGGEATDLERLGTSEDLAYVIYTSGSTGRPKGVQVTHRSLVNFLESMRREPGITGEDVLLSVTTLSFDIAGLELYLPLIVGGRVVLVSREESSDGERLLDRLRGSGATLMQATPATWRLLLEAGWSGDRRLKILCGGEALPRDLAERLLERGSSVWNMYGPTETTIWSTLWKVELDGGPVTVGRPIGNTLIHVLDGRGRRVPAGVPGELCIGGEGLARGYWRRPDLTAERFVPDPYAGEAGSRMYRTGDLVRQLPDGRVEWLSRLDHQVKVRGFRIELGEIESVLSRHGGVRQAVVMVREDVAGDTRLVAYVVSATAGTEVGQVRPELSGRLRTYLQESLPEHMVPTGWVFLDAFPLTPNGKVDRKSLPKPEALHAVGAYAAPETATDRTIAEVWQEVLRVERVGLYDNFFDLGGHSLLLMQVQAKLRYQLEREIPIVDLFRHSTVAALGRHLRNGSADGGPEPAEQDSLEELQVGRQRLQQRRRQHAPEER